MGTIFYTFLLLVIIFLGGCYKDNFKKLHPAVESCDTVSAVNYTLRIAPIINNFCVSCHATGNGGTVLDNYNDVKINAQSGKLYSSVIWDGNAQQMPQSSLSKIPDCDLIIIKKWISIGMPQN